MTTIILTIIGILLAAAAALMVIFYGGDAFNAGSVGARANTLQNAGTNVISALQLAKADGKDVSTFTTIASLKSNNKDDDYLKELPNFANVGLAAPIAPATSNVSLAAGQMQITGVPEDVCARVNKNLGITTATVSSSFKMGCATTGGIFFANS